MLHRRTNTNSSHPSHSSPSTSPYPSQTSQPLQSSQQSPANTTYKPLRRPSSQMYSTPQSASKARYSLPAVSPGLVVNTNTPYPGAGSYTPAGSGYGSYGSGLGGTLDLSDDAAWGDGKVDWVGKCRTGLDWVKKGLEDSSRVDRSMSLVFGDRELRTLVIKSTLINLVSLLLLSVSPLAFSSSLSLSPTAQHRTQSVGLWYNVLLSWPVFVTCFWLNSFWAPVISRRAHLALHPSYRHQPSTPSQGSSSHSAADVITKITTAIRRILMISDFTLVGHAIAFIPFIGRPLAVAYMCIIDSFYAFDPTFTSKGWNLDRKVDYLQERIPYMIGFGLPATLITSFGPPLVNMAVFALIYPFFVIQALVARPPTPRNSLLPSTPSPQASLPASPDGYGGNSSGLNLSNPFFTGTGSHSPLAPADWDVYRIIGSGKFVPIFLFARYAIIVLRWFEAAVLRDRRRGSGLGKERPGKRLG